MLDFLQTGKALYVLAVICGISVLTKWLTRNLYKRLIKESDNMILTKNKNLRSFKQKAETTYQMNQGIPKVKPYLERQMYEFRYLGASLHGWNLFSNQMTLLCFLAGGAGAFASYLLRTDSYYIVLYGSVGILGGLFTILMDHGMSIAEKRQQLFVSLDNYLENILLYRLSQDKAQENHMERPARQESRDNIRAIYPAEETEEESPIHSFPGKSAGIAKQEAETDSGNLTRRQRVKAERQKNQQAHSGRQLQQTQEGRGGRSPERSEGAYLAMEVKEEAVSEPIAGSDDAGPVASRRDVDYLKHSLGQIAASRERQRDVRKEEDWLKDLNPDELKLIGEIIHQYLT